MPTLPRCLVTWAVCCLAFSAFAADRRPNVIVILTDDQGSVDAGCYGSKDLVTPAIDSLAARGVRFTQFLAASSMCSPSRAGLLTGRYPLRCGLAGNAPSQAGKQGGLPTSEVTIAQTFKAAGYATGHVGKWHLGYTPEQMPNRRGFDFSFGFMGGCIDNYSHFFYWEGPNVHDLHRNGEEEYHPGEFFGDLVVTEAGKFLDAHKEGPFFLYFALNEPHYPYQPDVKWIEHFKSLPYPRNLYAAWLATADERIGRLLRKVDELGLRENTIIAFQSDQGHSTEERACNGGGSAGPYRGAKGSFFDGGIRIPAILSWPGHVPEGQVRGQLVHGCDWLPTLAEMCGVKLLNENIDGKSLLPIAMSAEAPSVHPILHFQLGNGPRAQWAVREGDWKLLGNAKDTSKTSTAPLMKELFLSNVAKDVGEQKNFAADEPEIVARLKKAHEDWVAEIAREHGH
jgi:arylsulfatase A-like enzyme